MPGLSKDSTTLFWLARAFFGRPSPVHIDTSYKYPQ